MGEVKRYRPCTFGDTAADRLERERDQAVSVADSMGRDAVEFSAKLAEDQAELTRLRAVEAAARRAIRGYGNSDHVDSLKALAVACEMTW